MTHTHTAKHEQSEIEKKRLKKVEKKMKKKLKISIF